MTRPIATVAVVALVVLSGCSVIGGGGSTATPAGTPASDDASTPTPTPTATAEPTPTPWSTATATPEPTPTPEPTESPTPTPTATPAPSTPMGDLEPVSALSSQPPGVENGKVTNVSALVAADQRHLRSGGFDLRMTIENSSREGVGRFRLANDTRSSLVRITEGGALGSGTDLSTYYGEQVSGLYNRSSGEVTYGYGPTRTRFAARFVTGIMYVLPKTYVGAPDWETAGSYTTDGGEERLVLHADSLRENRSSSQSGGVSGADEEVTSVDARAELTTDGLVRSLTLEVELDPANGEPYTQTISYTVEDLEAGELDRPGWLSKAPQLQASTSADDRLLVVEHTGGATIEAGTNLTVTAGTSLGNVSADQPIAPGDTIYVYATGEGRDRTPHLSVNQRPTLPTNATAFSRQVGLRGSQGKFTFAAVATVASDVTSGGTASLRVRPGR